MIENLQKFSCNDIAPFEKPRKSDEAEISFFYNYLFCFLVYDAKMNVFNVIDMSNAV